MKTKSYIFAGIIAAITMGNAYATGENTVTSKSYVDAMDATKQDKITAKTTGNVVTYNGTENGQTKFDEVGIYNGGAQYNESTDEDKLITAGTVANMATAIESITIPQQRLAGRNAGGGSLCAPSGCVLWEITDTTSALTAQGTLAPLTAAAPACKAVGVTVSSTSECCSGYFQEGTQTCGCATNSDCGSNGTCRSDHACRLNSLPGGLL